MCVLFSDVDTVSWTNMNKQEHFNFLIISTAASALFSQCRIKDSVSLNPASLRAALLWLGRWDRLLCLGWNRYTVIRTVTMAWVLLYESETEIIVDLFRFRIAFFLETKTQFIGTLILETLQIFHIHKHHYYTLH